MLAASDDATAGYVGDVITVGQYQANVDGLGAWVVQQTPAPSA